VRGFPLSVLFHHCSILIVSYMLLLTSRTNGRSLGTFIPDPNYLFLLLFLLGTVSLGFITLYSNDDIQVVRGSVWLVRKVESKAYLREYNIVGARWCIYQ
jgi:hypothetical protein